VPPYYDPLIAKVISWDTTREQAIDRLLEGLSEFAIEGFANSIPVNLLILQSAAYRSGDLSTAFLARLFEQEVDWAAHTPRSCRGVSLNRPHRADSLCSVRYERLCVVGP